MRHSTRSHAVGQRLLPFYAPQEQPVRREKPPHNSTPTSKAAAENIARRTPNHRVLVLAHVERCGHHGVTADEVCQALDMWPQSATPRINELAKIGDIVNSGRTRPTRSGRAAIVWISAHLKTGIIHADMEASAEHRI